jgi:hypothetical protein
MVFLFLSHLPQRPEANGMIAWLSSMSFPFITVYTDCMVTDLTQQIERIDSSNSCFLTVMLANLCSFIQFANLFVLFLAPSSDIKD